MDYGKHHLCERGDEDVHSLNQYPNLTLGDGWDCFFFFIYFNDTYYSHKLIRKRDEILRHNNDSRAPGEIRYGLRGRRRIHRHC